jgi:hypothetical protein
MSQHLQHNSTAKRCSICAYLVLTCSKCYDFSIMKLHKAIVMHAAVQLAKAQIDFSYQ